MIYKYENSKSFKSQIITNNNSSQMTATTTIETMYNYNDLTRNNKNNIKITSSITNNNIMHNTTTATNSSSSLVSEMKNLMKMKNSSQGAKDPSREENYHLIQLTLVLMVVLIVVGVIGNLINILVFSRRHMRKVSTFRFLLYLAITDMLVLLVCSTDALSKFGFQWEIRAQSTFSCRLHTFLTYLLTHSSSTILMVVSVDRALVVSNSSIRSLVGSIKDRGIMRKKSSSSSSTTAAAGTTAYSLAATNVRRRSTLQHRASATRLTIVGYSFYKVDVVTAIIFIVLALLNSHYLIMIDHSTIYEPNQNPLRTVLVAMAALSSSFNNGAGGPLRPNANSTSNITQVFSTITKIPKLASTQTTSPRSLFNDSARMQDLFFTLPSSSSSSSSSSSLGTPALALAASFLLNPSMPQHNDFTACFPPIGTPYHTFLTDYWFYIDMCIYWFIPFIVMSICSVIILGKIRNKNKRYFRKLLNNLNNKFNRSIIYKRSKKSRQILYMLLMTNMYFFLSQLPYCISFIMLRNTKSETTLGQFVVHVISYTNNAFNFLFYGFSSQYYRKQLLKIFKRTTSRS